MSIANATEVTTYRFTIDQYDRMNDIGVFDDRDVRVELLFGEIVEMSPPNPLHDYVIDLLNYWSIQNTQPEKIWVRIQNPLGIPEFDSVPEPDVAWMKSKDYSQRRPEPEDVLLLIEVAESSLGKDRHTKGKLYAEAGIQDYWIVNLNDARIEVYRDPVDGQFQTSQTVGPGDALSPLARPDVDVNVAKLIAR
jgi:Uma2 family endonuclease